MKTSKTSAAATCIFVLLMSFIACKKDQDTANPEKTFQEVLKEALPDYYIVAQHKTGGNILLSISFTKSGDNIHGEAHMQGYLRSKAVTINDSGLSYDFNSDGKSVYHFTIEKKEDGTFKLKSFDFVYNGETGLLRYAALFKKADIFSFTDAYYEGNTNSPFKFEGGKFRWHAGSVPPELHDYYSIGTGFKTNDSRFMGICVPNWLNNAKPMLLLEEGESLHQYQARP